MLLVVWPGWAQQKPKPNLSPLPTDVLKYSVPVSYVDIARDRIKLAYTDVGQGKPVLFIHDVGSTLESWAPSLKLLQQNNRCVALDLPGHGKSTKGMFALNPAYMADMVLQLMDHLELWQVHLVGHGVGAQVAAQLALRHPQRVITLAFVAPAGIEQFTPTQIQEQKTALEAENIRQMNDEQIEKAYEMQFFKLPEDAKALIDIRKTLRTVSGYGFYCYGVYKLLSSSLDESLLPILPRLQQPTLIVAGLSDKITPNTSYNPQLTPEELAKAASQKLKKGRYVVIPGAGHLVQYEQTEALNRQLQSFWLTK